MTEIPAGKPQIPGEDAPEGFTRNYVTVVKGHSCKWICKQRWDSVTEYEVLVNEELRTNARAIYNEETEEEFHRALYDNDADYARLIKYVLQCLVNQGLLKVEKHEGQDPLYRKTAKLYALCPEIVKYDLPVTKDMVEEYDRQHPS
jgi:hypothetical protein